MSDDGDDASVIFVVWWIAPEVQSSKRSRLTECFIGRASLISVTKLTAVFQFVRACAGFCFPAGAIFGENESGSIQAARDSSLTALCSGCQNLFVHFANCLCLLVRFSRFEGLANVLSFSFTFSPLPLSPPPTRSLSSLPPCMCVCEGWLTHLLELTFCCVAPCVRV